MNHDVIMNRDCQILVRNENEHLWSLADNIILVVHPLKFIFSYLSYLGWIGLGTNRFEFNSVQVISLSDLHRVNKSSGQFGFDSGYIGFRVNLGHHSFGSLQFRVGSVLGRFNFEFRVEISSTLSHVGSGLVSDHSVRVTFGRSSFNRLKQVGLYWSRLEHVRADLTIS